MDFSDKQEGWIETGTAVGTGILAWEAEATAKYAKAYAGYPGLFDAGRFADALAGILGNKVTKKLFPSWTGAADNKSLSIVGAINKTSMTGVAVLITDAVLKAVVPEYKKLPAVSSVVKGAGMGMTVGGIVGGIFDPAPPAAGNQNRNQSPQSSFGINGAF